LNSPPAHSLEKRGKVDFELNYTPPFLCKRRESGGDESKINLYEQFLNLIVPEDKKILSQFLNKGENT